MPSVGYPGKLFSDNEYNSLRETWTETGIETGTESVKFSLIDLLKLSKGLFVTVKPGGEWNIHSTWISTDYIFIITQRCSI